MPDSTVVAPPPARRLPGALRAAGYIEPLRKPIPAEPVSADDWSTEFATAAPEFEVPEVAYVPPAAQEPPGEWSTLSARLLKVLSLGFAKPAPGLAELAHRGNVRLIRTAVWPRCVRVAVANPKGNAGKTTTAVVLGGILASIRGGSTAVWDASDAAGTLTSRSEGTALECISMVAADPSAYWSPSNIGMAASTQTSFADVIGSQQDRAFYHEDIENVSDVLDRSYRVSVADTSNTPHSPAFEAVIAKADILVCPTILQADSVNKAVALLRRLHDSGELPQRAVVAVLHSGGPETPGLAEQVDGIFEALGVGAIVHIPFDPHLGAGTEITLASLSHASTVAWTELAAATVANINIEA